MKPVTLAGLIIGLTLGVGIGDAQAASCRTHTGSALWQLHVSPENDYLIRIRSLNYGGSTTVRLYDECWFDSDRLTNGAESWGETGTDSYPWQQHCGEPIDIANPRFFLWGAFWWTASDSLDYLWVDTTAENTYRICLY